MSWSYLIADTWQMKPLESKGQSVCHQSSNTVYTVWYCLLDLLTKNNEPTPLSIPSLPSCSVLLFFQHISYPLPLIPDALIVFDTAISTYLSADYDFDCAGWWQHLASGSLKKKKLLMEISSRRWCAPGGFHFCPCACDRYICNLLTRDRELGNLSHSQ